MELFIRLDIYKINCVKKEQPFNDTCILDAIKPHDFFIKRNEYKNNNNNKKN